MQIQEKSLNELRPYKNNPRKNDAAVGPVAESIKEFGFKVPIVVDQSGEIVAGHTRYKAAKKLGLKKVPVIIADDLTPEQIQAFRLADNKVGELAEWDFELLGIELPEITTLDMSLFGFEAVDIEDETPEAEEDYFEPDLEKEPTSIRGQIYELGNHRLMIGDSTDAGDVAKLMSGALADLVVTDPPYNVDYGSTDPEEIKRRKLRKDGKQISNDAMSAEQFADFLERASENIAGALKPGGAFYVWHASKNQGATEEALRSAGLEVRQQLIWNKNIALLGRQDYQWKHEPCFYGWKDGAAHYFVDDRTQRTVFEDKGVNIKQLKKHEMQELLEKLLGDKVSTTVINEDKPVASELHPTMKPIKLMARQIKNSSRQFETVLDPFGGSGSTLIACEQLQRRCYTMELDPIYADAIIERWAQLTGRKAKLLEE